MLPSVSCLISLFYLSSIPSIYARGWMYRYDADAVDASDLFPTKDSDIPVRIDWTKAVKTGINVGKKVAPLAGDVWRHAQQQNRLADGIQVGKAGMYHVQKSPGKALSLGSVEQRGGPLNAPGRHRHV